MQAAALGTLARVALARGNGEEALSLATRGIAAARRIASPRDVSILHLARIEALAASGRKAEEAEALADARERILRIAATIDDPALRESYLTRVEANARTMAHGAAG